MAKPQAPPVPRARDWRKRARDARDWVAGELEAGRLETNIKKNNKPEEKEKEEDDDDWTGRKKEKAWAEDEDETPVDGGRPCPAAPQPKWQAGKPGSSADWRSRPGRRSKRGSGI